MKTIWKEIRSFFADIDFAHRQKAAEAHQWEEAELRNVFALIVLGSFAGFPLPPVQVTAELLPLLDKDLDIMFERMGTAHDPLGELFSVFDIG